MVVSSYACCMLNYQLTNSIDFMLFAHTILIDLLMSVHTSAPLRIVY